MADSEKDSVKEFAIKNAGDFFKFDDHGKTLVGKVVGYYPALAFLVMEVPTPPNLAIDPIQAFLQSNYIPLTKGSYYCYCLLRDIDTGKTNLLDKSRYPSKCPRCAQPAYLGAVPNSLDCSNVGCVSKK